MFSDYDVISEDITRVVSSLFTYSTKRFREFPTRLHFITVHKFIVYILTIFNLKRSYYLLGRKRRVPWK